MDKKIGLGIFLFCFVLTLFLSPRISVSWDEPDNIWAAGVYINFFRSGFNPEILLDKNASASYFHEKIFTQEPSLYRYPPFPLYIGAIIALIWEKAAGALSSQQIITAFHIASGLFWGVLAVTVYYFARLFKCSFTISLIVSLITAFHPTLFGYGLSIIKDSAQVSLFTLSLFFLVKYGEIRNRTYFIVGTLIWGAAMATKFNAIYVPVIWGIWALLREKITVTHSIRVLKNLLLLGIVGMLVMIILWPYLWYDPIARLQEVSSYFTTVGTGYKVYWNANVYTTGTGSPLPWYPLVHMFIGTPIPVILSSLFGIITLLILVLKQRTTYLGWLILLSLWGFVPLARTFGSYAAFYDGMRHFLEVLPAFMLCSVWGLEAFSQFLAKRLGSIQYGRALIGVAFLSYFAMLHIYLFPYSYGYVNAFLRDPNSTVERDFAGLSVAEGVRIAHAIRPQPSRIFVPIGGHLSWYYLAFGDQYVYTVADSDIIILINKPSHVTKTYFDTEVSSMFDIKGGVMRGNTIFAWVYVRKN
jgi:hypothetical protein